MTGINYSLGLDPSNFQAGAGAAMRAINQLGKGIESLGDAGGEGDGGFLAELPLILSSLQQRIDALSQAGGGSQGAEEGFLGTLSTILFQLPQQVMAVAGILQTMAVPVRLAAEAETVAVAFRTLVGDVDLAAETLEKVQDMADATPFDPDQLVQASRSLIAFGEGAATIPETLRRLGDVASGTGTDINELAQLYGKARIAGTLFTEDINEMTGRGIPVIQEFAAILGVGVDKVKELASQGQVSFAHLEEAFDRLTAPGGKFSGMMDELSRTMEGKLSNLTAAAENAVQAMGDGMLEGLKPYVDGITEQVGKLESVGQSIGTTLRDALDMTAVIAESENVIMTLDGLFGMLGLTIANELAKGAAAGFELLQRSVYDGIMAAEAQVREWMGDQEGADEIREGIGERAEHVFDGIKRTEGPLDGLIAKERKTWDEVKRKTEERQTARATEQKGRDDARFRAADEARQDTERQRFTDHEWRKSTRASQLKSLENAKAAGLGPEQIDEMRNVFLSSAVDMKFPAEELAEMRREMGMEAYMSEADSKARRKSNVDAVIDARKRGKSATEIQKMQKDFVASATRDGMEAEQLAGLKKDFGMEDEKDKPASTSGAGAGPRAGTGPAAPAGAGPAPGRAAAADPDNDRRIRRRGLRESIERGFQRQAGTGRGSVNWQTWVGRQIGLTPAQRRELLRSGPDAQSLDRVTGRGQERRSRNAAAAEQARDKEQGAQQQAARDKALQQILKHVESIDKELKDEGGNS